MEGRSLISLLVHMTMDNEKSLLDRKEYLYDLAHHYGVSEEEVDYLIEYPDPMPSLDGLTEKESFTYLCTAIQFMKYGGRVRRKEAVFCQHIATQMGYYPQVVYEVSSFIYSNPVLKLSTAFLKNLTHMYVIRK